MPARKRSSRDAATITEVLTKAGWKKTPKGEVQERANLGYKNRSVTISVEQGSKSGWLTLSIYEKPTLGSDFELHHRDKLDQVLKEIVRSQDEISFSNYKTFLQRILQIVPDTFVDTDDGLVPLVDE
jgi:hypothetical protein